MKNFFVTVAVAWTCVWVSGALTEEVVEIGNRDTKAAQTLSPFSAERDNATKGLSSSEKSRSPITEASYEANKIQEPSSYDGKYGKQSCSRSEPCGKTECCPSCRPRPQPPQCCNKMSPQPPCPCKPKRKPKGVAAVVALHQTRKSCKKCSAKCVPAPPTCWLLHQPSVMRSFFHCMFLFRFSFPVWTVLNYSHKYVINWWL